MVIVLHIADIAKDLTNGVHVAVPQHVKAQAELAQVLFVNLRNINVLDDAQCEYKGAANFPDYLPNPFNRPDLAVKPDRQQISGMQSKSYCKKTYNAPYNGSYYLCNILLILYLI